MRDGVMKKGNNMKRRMGERENGRRGISRLYSASPLLRFPVSLSAILLLTLGLSLSAYGAGGDSISPFPISDSQIGKQESATMAIDSQGNVIVTGYTSTTATNDFYTVKFNYDGSGIAWTAAFDKSSTDDRAIAVVVDSNNDVIVTGSVGSGQAVNIQTIKYNGATGAIISQLNWNGGANGADYPTALAVDGGNNVYVVGYSYVASENEDWVILKYKYNNADKTLSADTSFDSDGVVTYGGTANKKDMIASIAAGSSGIVVAGRSSYSVSGFDYLTRKYDLNGNYLWERRYSSAGTSAYNDPGPYVRIDSLGDAVFTGGLSAGSNKDIYTAKYSGADGSVIWQRTYAGEYNDEPRALWLDAAGDVYLTGYTWTLAGRYEFYTVRYSSAGDGSGNGVVVWEKKFGSGGDNDDVAVPTGIVVGDDVFVTGYTYKSASGDYDFQTLKYKKDNGNQLWQKSYDGAAGKDDIPAGIGLAPDGRVYVSGWTNKMGTVDSGVASAESTTVLIKDASKTWAENRWANYHVKMTSGTNNGLERDILSNTGDTLTISASNPFPSAVSSGDAYYIYDPQDYDYVVIKYDQGLLNAPTSLTAAAVTSTEVALTWSDNSSNEDGFKIERKLCTEATYTVIDTISSNPTGTATYSDTSGVQPDTKYCYQVRAYNAANGDTYPSNEAHALTTIVPMLAPSWSSTYDGGVGHDYATAIAVGPDNNPVVTGYSLFTENSYDYYTIKLSRQDGSLIWNALYDGDQSGGHDQADTVAVDSNNGVLVSGYSWLYNVTTGNTNDIYTIKYYSPQQNPQEAWHAVYNGPAGSDDYSIAVATAVDGLDNVAVVGYGMNSAGNMDMYVVKYSSSGSLLWQANPYNGSGGNDIPSAVAFDASGNIFVTGYTCNAANTDCDIVTRKYSGSTGSAVWTDIYPDGHGGITDYGIDEAKAIAIDSADNVYVTGYTTNSSGNADMFTIKYFGADSGGTPWTDVGRSFDGEAHGSDEGVSIKIDPIDGRIIVAGTTLTGTGNSDYKLIWYLPNTGTVDTEKTLYRDEDETAAAMSIDISGNVCVAGTTMNSTYDMMSIKYNYEGTIIGATTFDGAASGADHASAVAINSLGEAFVAGYTTNTAGNYDYAVFKCAWDPLQVPAPVTASSSYTSVTLNWADNSTGNDGYRAEKKFDACSTSNTNLWSSVVSCNVSANATTCTDSALPTGTTYCYRIQAYKNNGESSRWIEKTVSTQTPAAPTGITAAAASATQINISWNDNTNPETGFTLMRCTADVGVDCSLESHYTYSISLGSNSTSSMSYSDTTVCKGDSYRYRVRAESTGSPAWQTEWNTMSSNISTPTPSAPTGLTAVRASESQINVTWNDNTGGTTEETGFKIERCIGASCTEFTFSGSSTGTGVRTLNDTGLEPDTTYTYRVKAYKTATCSWDTDYSSVTAASATTTVIAPSNITAAVSSATQINVSWNDNTVSETGFTLMRCTADVGVDCSLESHYTYTISLGSNSTSSMSYSDTSVCKNTSYRYRVRAEKTSGTTWTTAWNAMSSNVATPNLSAPTSQSASRVSETQITITWNDNTSGTTEETGFKMERCIGASCTELTVSGTSGTGLRTYQDSGLEPTTTYDYRVKAYKTASCPWETGLSSTMTATTSISAPGSMTANEISSTQVNLSWSDLTSSETGFKIYRCLGSSCTPAAPAIGWAASGSTGYSDTSVCQGTTYNYHVTAVNEKLSNSNNGCWTKYAPLDITNLQADIQSRLTITYSDFSGMQSDFDDIRFYDETAKKEIPYWIEKKTDGSAATVWIKPGANNSIRMYYGNSSAASASDGSKVFEFFDDFSGTTISTSKWTEVDTGSNYYTQNNELVSSGGTSNWNTGLYSVSTFTRPFIFEIDHYRTTGSYMMLGIKDSGSGISYTDFVYAAYPIYDGSGNWLQVYQDGGYIGQYNSISSGVWQYYKIEVMSTGAKYYYGSSTNSYSLFRDSSSYSSESPLKVGFTNYNQSFKLDNARVRKYTATEPSITILTPVGDGVTCQTVTGSWESAASNTDTATTYTPVAPSGITANAISESQISLSWTDNTSGATQETGFRIERKAEACSLNALSYVSLVPIDDGFTSIDSQLWQQRGRVYDAAGTLVAEDTVAPIAIVDATNGNSSITESGSYAELSTTGGDGNGQANVYNDTRIYLKSAGVIQGDFDTQVDYSLPTGQITSSQTHVYGRLQIFFPNSGSNANYAYVERRVSGAGNAYYADLVISGTSNTAVAVTSDTGGKLRLKRSGSTISAYVETGGAWTLIKQVTSGPTATATDLSILQMAQRNEAATLQARLDNFKLDVSNADKTTLADTNLSQETSYCYRVSARKNATCPWEVTSVAPDDATTLVPPAPTNITATAASATEITVSWNDNTGAETGFTLMRCTVDIGVDCSLESHYTYTISLGSNSTSNVSYSDTTVCKNTSYRYRVRADKNTTPAWNTAWNAMLSDVTTPIPLVPTGLAALRISESQINVTWNDNTSGTTEETGFKIEKCIGASCSEVTVSGTSGTGVRTYQDTGLEPSTTYTYRVKAYKTASCAWDTDYNNVTAALATTTVSAPSNITATASSATQITVSWNDNTATETGFTLMRCTADVGVDCSLESHYTYSISLGSNSTSSMSYSDTSVCKNTSYRYRVRAEKTSGTTWTTAWNTMTSNTTTPNPSVPSGLTAVRVSEIQINVSWNDNTSGTTEETGFKIDKCVGASCSEVTVSGTSGTGVRTYQDTNLDPETTYGYRVKAYKTATCSWDTDYNVITQVTATTSVAPPSNLTGAAIDTTTIILTWNDNTAAETGFKIQRCEGSACDFSSGVTEITTSSGSSSTKSYADSTVCKNTTYRYRVRAEKSTNKTYNSGWNTPDPITVTTPDATIPENLTAGAISHTEIKLSWTDKTTDETGFKVYRCMIDTGIDCNQDNQYSEIGTAGAGTGQGTTVTFTDSGRNPSTTYCYRVAAYKTTTCSWLTGYSSKACDLTFSATPSGLTATAINSMKIQLSWTDVAVDETGFEIETRIWNGQWVKIADVGPNVQSFIDTKGIEPLKQYKYRIRTVRDGSKSPYSSEATVTYTSGGTTIYTTPAYTSGDNTCEYALMVTVSGSGSVGFSPTGVSCGTNCYAYTVGAEVTLTAKPSTTVTPAPTFTGWSGACSGNSTTCTVTMDGDKGVTATFSQ